jgi:hypothetical protein
VTEALKVHARRSRDLTYALAAEWRQAMAKPRQQTRLFELISIKLKYLQIMLTDLSGLRRRCDEPRAKSRHYD